MAEYPSNSYQSKQEKQEEKHYEPIITHSASVKKKSPIQRFSDIFIAEDFKSVMNYVTKEILIPGLKRAVIGAIEMMLTGKSSSKNSNSASSGVTTVSYRSYYDTPQQSKATTTIRDEDYANFERIIFTDRGDAERVRDMLIDIVRRYRVARVSDLFELSKLPAPYTAMRYGWTDLSNASVIPVGNGYAINLPRAFPLD